ncbi:irregular chiasm C-roughest protein-like [Hyposmocoma kahamanoa]|uniref:irregular chiasm C-roughest protein-like n=1 Tax=Hyposmocoma kahamanoa TaxID=1477025 RepID=UPI000E6D7D85|nr:irregular chiasm C-roughest protein-like [Hyposmocoma kahamanoa]
MYFEELRETNGCRDSASLTILFGEDVSVFRETIEDQKYGFRSEPNADSNKSDHKEEFSAETEYSNEETNIVKHLEVNMNSSNNTVENLNNNDIIKVASKMTKNKSILEKDKTQRNVTSRSANTLFLLLRILKSLPIFLSQVMVIIILVSFVCALKEQRFAIEPQDQSAVVGSRVTLPCRVENKVGQLQWTKDDFGLGTHRHLNGYEQYKMIGSDEEGDYSLDIAEVTLDDDALYQCQVSSGPRGEPPIRSRYARLLILMPPEPPNILQGPVLQAVEDREVNLECVSVGGKPAAEITWVDNDGGVLTQGVTYNVEQMPDGRRFTARSILHLRPRRHHHNQTFTCQAQNTADRAYRAVSIKLEVQFAPKIRMYFKSGAKNGRAQEGDTLVLGCQATANPNILTYKWYINNVQIVSSVSHELVIRNITRHHNEATAKCEVNNAVGKSADTKTLEVSYGPTFKVKPENVEGEDGSIATLTCVVDGHPQPKLLWLRYENERIIRMGKLPNLTVTISQETAGQYWCRASVENYPDVEASAMVYVKGSPKIMSNQTQYGVEGDSVKIECVAFSVPKPDYVLWSLNGIEINSFHNQEYAFLEETLSDRITKSTLIIRESQERHFGTYNCSVTNVYGTDSVEIRLVADKTLPLILIISAGSSAAVLVLIIMLIIMLCHRKTRQSDVKKPDITDVGKTCDQFKDSDRSSNISDMKMELRQVEGGCDMENSNAGSETELHSTLHLTTNLGLPLAGPVPVPEAVFDNELMKQYQRYSGDFNQALTNLHFKAHSQSNGYVPYVDYTRDYAPPTGDSLTGSLTRSNDTYPSHCGSLHRQASCGRLGGMVGPDVIPMANPGIAVGGADVRYAATYGNPYLRGSGPLSYVPQVTSAISGVKPPPYYSIKNSSLALPVITSVSSTSPSSSSSSRPITSPMASSSSSGGAQPQVPKTLPQSPGALYVLPPSSQGSLKSKQITVKGTGSQLKAGTHV